MNSKKGMTLVELLVVLVILASLAVSVAVSSAGAIDRAKRDRTIRQGEAMRDALERPDGLSIVSDLGPIFDTATANDDERDARNRARLGYLFCPSNRFEIMVGEDASLHQVDAFKELQLYKTLTCPLLPTNAASLTGVSKEFTELTNKFGVVSLGCGWRGPYCGERVLDSDFTLRDGFGGIWECFASPTNCLLVSRGLDRAADGLDTSKTWQEEDLLFEVRTRDAVSLSISIDETTLNATPVKKLHVFTYSPSFSISATAADETIPVTIETAYTNAVGQAAIEVTSGLSVGSRMVFAFVEDEGGKCYAARPQRIVLRPGSNHLQNLKLINEATTP